MAAEAEAEAGPADASATTTRRAERRISLLPITEDDDDNDAVFSPAITVVVRPASLFSRPPVAWIEDCHGGRHAAATALAPPAGGVRVVAVVLDACG